MYNKQKKKKKKRVFPLCVTVEASSLGRVAGRPARTRESPPPKIHRLTEVNHCLPSTDSETFNSPPPSSILYSRRYLNSYESLVETESMKMDAKNAQQHQQCQQATTPLSLYIQLGDTLCAARNGAPIAKISHSHWLVSKR